MAGGGSPAGEVCGGPAGGGLIGGAQGARSLGEIPSGPARRVLRKLGELGEGFDPQVVVLGPAAVACWDPDPPPAPTSASATLVVCPRPGRPTRMLLRLLTEIAVEPIRGSAAARRWRRRGRLEVTTQVGRLRVERRPAGSGGFGELARAAEPVPTDGGRLGSSPHLLVASPAQLVRTGWLTAARADDLIGALETAAPRDSRAPPAASAP